MLSYRHAFHAGNFADVLKHLILVEILRYYGQKDKAFAYIDTHAGAGLYSLDSAEGEKTGEYRDGIGKLYGGMWPELDEYFALIGKLNPKAALRYYPGSPLIAQALCRPQDRLWLHELHPRDVEHLSKNCAGDKRVRISQSDGYQGLLAQLPPVSRRAVVLIDPPYELKEDYQRVVDTLAKAHAKFPQGCYALWYPIVERIRAQQLEKRLKATGIRNIQTFELGLHSDSAGFGMSSSKMLVINPPWTLMNTMQDLLPRLAKALDNSNEAFSRCEQLVAQ